MLVLWVDGLATIDECKEYKMLYTETQDELQEWKDKYYKLEWHYGEQANILNEQFAKHDSLLKIDYLKTQYINGFGYEINWNKAQQLYESNTNIQARYEQ